MKGSLGSPPMTSSVSTEEEPALAEVTSIRATTPPVRMLRDEVEAEQPESTINKNRDAAIRMVTFPQRNTRVHVIPFAKTGQATRQPRAATQVTSSRRSKRKATSRVESMVPSGWTLLFRLVVQKPAYACQSRKRIDAWPFFVASRWAGGQGAARWAGDSARSTP